MSVLKMKRWKNVLNKQIGMQPKTNPILIWCELVLSSSRAGAAILIYTQPVMPASLPEQCYRNHPHDA